MRDLVGLNARAVARRYSVPDRLVLISLYKNRYADPAGPQLNLSLGERTSYRSAAHILDRFDRADGALGIGYEPWVTPTGFTGLVIANQRVEPADTGVVVEQFETHSIVLPRDQWAEVTIRGLDAVGSGSYASAGVILRASPPDGTGRAYVIVAVDDGDTRKTRLGRLRDGTLEWLAEPETPWRDDDVLRATAYWSLLRVYRNGVLILSHTDSDPLLVDGRAGVEAIALVSGDVASLNDFIAGPLRQEYLGQVLDMGDASASLGLVEPTASPASFDLNIGNIGPVGGATRFAKLLRQGRNISGYDQFQSDVRVLVGLRGGSAPMSAARGVIDGVADMTEESVRIQCVGIDGLLDPVIDVGRVIYLGGSPPSLSGPPTLPEECAPAPTPDEIPGDIPEEPDETLPVEGAGPESPPGEDDGETEPETPDGGGGSLMGGYIVVLDVKRGDTGADPPEPEWVTQTTVTQVPDPSILAVCPDSTGGDFISYSVPLISVTLNPLSGPTSFNAGNHLCHAYRSDPPVGEILRRMVMYYRGPDILGTDLGTDESCLGVFPPSAGVPQLLVSGTRGLNIDETSDPIDTSATGFLARFDATGIHTVADLEALVLGNPDEGSDYELHLPVRIETLATLNTSNESTNPISGATPIPILSGDPTIPLDQFAGPQLIGVEIGSYTGFGDATDFYVEIKLVGGYLDGATVTAADFFPGIVSP